MLLQGRAVSGQRNGCKAGDMLTLVSTMSVSCHAPMAPEESIPLCCLLGDTHQPVCAFYRSAKNDLSPPASLASPCSVCGPGGHFKCRRHASFCPAVTTAAVSCKPGQFRCGDGLCLNATDRCNGHWDCADRSDEDNCCKAKARARV